MATVKGQALAFGIPAELMGLVTQRVSVSKTCQIKEARDKEGKVVAAAFYKNQASVTVEGYGDGSGALLGALTVPAGVTVDGAVTIDEITTDASNEDFVKQSIKATAYTGVS